MIHNLNLYGKRKPCHERAKPRPHEWEVDAHRSYDDAIETELVCRNCKWGMDMQTFIDSYLPTSGSLFHLNLDMMEAGHE